MQYFAAQGLVQPIDDVWEKIGGSFSPAAKKLSNGLDGHQYLVPIYNYPWVVFYNKSHFTAKGYTVPTTWDDLIALVKKMKADGIIPFAFADKDGWPALGTFDILNMRINGFDYHIKLMHNKAPWTDQGVTRCSSTGPSSCRTSRPAPTAGSGRTRPRRWKPKQAGMMFQGTNQVAAQYVTDRRTWTTWTSSPSPRSTRSGARTTWTPPPTASCSAEGQEHGRRQGDPGVHRHRPRRGAYLKTDQWDVGLVNGLQVPTYNAIQKKSVEAISSARRSRSSWTATPTRRWPTR